MEDLDALVARTVRDWRERIGSLPGPHVALEALWDGDTDGWMLDVRLISHDGERLLQTLRFGGDFRLFEGTVPPWPEAEVARRAGAEVARELGLELYFPSPNHPDDDCPRYREREQATLCRQCGKPLREAKGVCFPCQLEAERRQRLVDDAPGHAGNRALFALVEEDGRLRSSLFLNLGYAAIVPALAAELARRSLTLSENLDTTLLEREIASLAAFLEEAIDDLVARYQPRTDVPEHFLLPMPLVWRGVERTVQLRFNELGAQLSSLVGYHAFFSAPHRPIQLVGNGGIGYRDVDLLCRMAVREGAWSDEELRVLYPFLPPTSLDATLTRLEQRRFLVRDGSGVRLTARGRVVNVAGP